MFFVYNIEFWKVLLGSRGAAALPGEDFWSIQVGGPPQKPKEHEGAARQTWPDGTKVTGKDPHTQVRCTPSDVVEFPSYSML